MIQRFFLNSRAAGKGILLQSLDAYQYIHLCFLSTVEKDIKKKKKKTRLLPDLKLSENVPNHAHFKIVQIS